GRLLGRRRGQLLDVRLLARRHIAGDDLELGDVEAKLRQAGDVDAGRRLGRADIGALYLARARGAVLALARIGVADLLGVAVAVAVAAAKTGQHQAGGGENDDPVQAHDLIPVPRWRRGARDRAAT